MLRTLLACGSGALLSCVALGADIRALGVCRQRESVYDVVYRVRVEQTREGAPAQALEMEQRARVRIAPVNPEETATAERGAVVEFEASVDMFSRMRKKLIPVSAFVS